MLLEITAEFIMYRSKQGKLPGVYEIIRNASKHVLVNHSVRLQSKQNTNFKVAYFQLTESIQPK